MSFDQTIVTSIIIALQVGIVIVIVLEVYHFRRKRTVITGGQFVLRMAIGAVFLALLSLLFGGIIGAFRFRSTESELWFWMSCLIMVVVLLFLLLVDAHLLYKSKMHMRERLYEDLARDMLRSIAKRAVEQQNQSKDDEGTTPDDQSNANRT
ncbi:MAG: hypothetical protein RMK18_02970 [Armatimonadota bacterium]|nr:hypothetical protein [Armatimonadota bacterium]MCX7776977.1 hypothetical protein [Armatimonadota bacterium]MDW8024811.1 hypothetical protein [Armatimonadota bacterium]